MIIYFILIPLFFVLLGLMMYFIEEDHDGLAALFGLCWGIVLVAVVAILIADGINTFGDSELALKYHSLKNKLSNNDNISSDLWFRCMSHNESIRKMETVENKIFIDKVFHDGAYTNYLIDLPEISIKR